MSQESWYEARLGPIPRHSLSQWSQWLFQHGAAGLEEQWLPGEAPAPRQPWDQGPAPAEPDRLALVAWYDHHPGALVAQLPSTARAIGDLEPALDIHPLEDRDWEGDWKKSFAPIEVAPGLVVAPPWDAPPGAVVIEPGQGFGTGQHPSTLGALRLAWALRRSGGTVLDVGTGSGILAIALAKQGMTAWGIDVERPALRNAQENADRNQVRVRLDATPLQRVSGTFDLVLANLHAELVVELASDLARVCHGHLVVAGILHDRRGKVQEALSDRFALEHHETDGEWVAQVWRRR